MAVRKQMVKGYKVGEVAEYDARFHVAAIKVDVKLRVGDRIQLIGPLTDFIQIVESMELGRQDVQEAGASKKVHIPVEGPVRAGDAVVLLPS